MQIVLNIPAAIEARRDIHTFAKKKYMKPCLTVLCAECVSVLLIAMPVFGNNPIIDDYEKDFDFYDYDFESDSEASEFIDRLQIASVTVLMDAARNGTPDDIKKLLKDGEYIHAKDYEGKTALIYAVENNTPEVVQTLINAGAYVSKFFLLDFVDDRGDYFESYRHIKYPEIVSVLVKAGADVNARDDQNNTALMKALGRYSHASIGVIKALIEAGADVNARNNEAKTALILAAATESRSEAIRVLITAGADINAEDNDGKTVLMYAAENYDDKTVNVLLDFGADIDAKDKTGKTALDYAKHSKYISNYILKRLGASWYQLHWF